MPTPPRRGAPTRGLTAAVIALALAGAATLVLRPRSEAPPSSSPADAAASAHAAGGIVTGPEVQAAFDGRVRDLEARLKAAPDDRGLVLELARLLHDGHRTREAIAHYRRAVALEPADPIAQYDLAAAHGEVGEWTEAREVLRARVAAAPGDAVALYDLGVTEVNLGDGEAAVRSWERARAAAGADAALGARIDEAIARVGAAPRTPPPR